MPALGRVVKIVLTRRNFRKKVAVAAAYRLSRLWFGNKIFERIACRDVRLFAIAALASLPAPTVAGGRENGLGLILWGTHDEEPGPRLWDAIIGRIQNVIRKMVSSAVDLTQQAFKRRPACIIFVRQCLDVF